MRSNFKFSIAIVCTLSVLLISCFNPDYGLWRGITEVKTLPFSNSDNALSSIGGEIIIDKNSEAEGVTTKYYTKAYGFFITNDINKLKGFNPGANFVRNPSNNPVAGIYAINKNLDDINYDIPFSFNAMLNLELDNIKKIIPPNVTGKYYFVSYAISFFNKITDPKLATDKDIACHTGKTESFNISDIVIPQ